MFRPRNETVVHKFVSALQGQRASGVFITTATFSRDATDYKSLVDMKRGRDKNNI